MTLRRATRWLLVLVLGLPLVQAVLVWTAGLLAAMGDEAGAAVVGRINTGAGVAWLVSLVGLVVVMALASLESSRNRGDDELP
jgi:hypothetical protein